MMALLSAVAVRNSRGRTALEGLGSSTGTIRVQTEASVCVSFTLWAGRMDREAEHLEKVDLENIDEMGE